MNNYYPRNVKVSINLERLFKVNEKRGLTDRMSSRMVKCASALSETDFIGWQIIVPTRGLASLSVFGTEQVSRSDLEWIIEKTGQGKKNATCSGINKDLSELYEIYLPVAEAEEKTASIGFGNNLSKADKGVSLWPAFYSAQFEEMVRILRNCGGAMRVAVGPATPEEVANCKRKTLQSYNNKNVDVEEYIGQPVKIRVLLLLSSAPSLRFKAMLNEFVRGAKIRYIGSMRKKTAVQIWSDPLDGSVCVPDYAARILVMEPIIHEPVIGIRLCNEPAKMIPSSHANSSKKNSVVIGKAVDTSGLKRNIAIGEIDLKRHYQIVGQTGTGKSTLLATTILSAIEKGYGLTFFDPHGSTIDVILRALPEKYSDRVRVVRIGDAENPVPMNIWDSDDPEKEERNISDLCELFGDIFNPPGEVFVGPRYERWLSTFAKASIAFLGSRASLESIAVLSQSQENMLKVSKKIVGKYPLLVESIKQEFGLDRSQDFHNNLGWYLCKFQRLTSVEQLRKTLGAGANALDFLHTIDSDKVTLVDLASPAIGTHAAQIIGTLILMKLWNAILVRKERNRTHLVVLDEASLFQTNPVPKMLAESRKFGISMILSHQHMGQLSREIRDALESNSANFSAFRMSTKDAFDAAIRFDDPELRTVLTRLDAFYAITSLSLDGHQTAPFTLQIVQPKLQKNGDAIARKIEARSIETLVEPYRDKSALTPSEILALLDSKTEEYRPTWLKKWETEKEKIARIV